MHTSIKISVKLYLHYGKYVFSLFSQSVLSVPQVRTTTIPPAPPAVFIATETKIYFPARKTSLFVFGLRKCRPALERLLRGLYFGRISPEKLFLGRISPGRLFLGRLSPGRLFLGRLSQGDFFQGLSYKYILYFQATITPDWDPGETRDNKAVVTDFWKGHQEQGTT